MTDSNIIIITGHTCMPLIVKYYQGGSEVAIASIASKLYSNSSVNEWPIDDPIKK